MKNGQTQFKNTVTFLFLIVAVIIISIFASVLNPFLNTQATVNNLTGGFGLITKYWNLLILGILMFVGVILVFSRGGNQ